jgi:hypothetical protein
MSVTIKPRLGLGDLLIIKMIYKSKINKIIISKKLIYDYRLEPEKYIIFLNKFIKNLFNDIELIYDNDLNNLLEINEYNFDNSYIFDKYKFNIHYDNIYENYIIIHTKARFDYLSNKFNTVITKKLMSFFENFKSRYKILLLGERNVEQNYEARLHNIKSLYEILLLLKKNNDLIDLTYDNLYSGNNYDDFEKDLFIINNAKYNIGFGYGGPLNISMAFSLNNIFYIDDLKHKCLDIYQNINKNIYRDIDNFINFIEFNC